MLDCTPVWQHYVYQFTFLRQQHPVFPYSICGFWFNLELSPNFPQLCKYLTVVPPPAKLQRPTRAHKIDIIRARALWRAPIPDDWLNYGLTLSTFDSALLPQSRIIIKCKIIQRGKTILYGGRAGGEPPKTTSDTSFCMDTQQNTE